jgi:hypothetical protein
MIDYKLEDLGEIVRISIPTTTTWGTILFAYEKSNVEFTSALESKGIDVFVNLLVNNPNTAYTEFVNG